MATYRFDLTTRQISEVSLPIPPQVTIQATGTAQGLATVLGVSSVREATGTAQGRAAVAGVGAFIGVGQSVGTAQGRATVSGYAVPIRSGQGTGQANGQATAQGVGLGLVVRDATGTAQGTAMVSGVANYDPHFSKVVLFVPGEFSDGTTPMDQSRYRRVITSEGAVVVNNISPQGVVGSVRGWVASAPSTPGAVVVRSGVIPAEMNPTGRTFTFEAFCKVVDLGEDEPTGVYGYTSRGDVFTMGKTQTWEYGIFPAGIRLFFADKYTVVANFVVEIGGAYAFAAPVQYAGNDPSQFVHVALVVEGGQTVRIYTNGVHSGGGVIGPLGGTLWVPQDGNVVIGHRIIDVYDDENPVKDFGFGGHIAQLRLTMDVARYTGASFTVPPIPFARYGD